MNEYAIVRKVGENLINNNITISFAESATGGMAMSMLTSIPGISKIFEGGIVCYHENIKRRILKVPPTLLEQYSCESQPASTAIAKGIARLIPTNISVGITGLASPGASESKLKPVGTIFISIIMYGRIYEKEIVLHGQRDEIRRNACLETFKFLDKILISVPVTPLVNQFQN